MFFFLYKSEIGGKEGQAVKVWEGMTRQGKQGKAKKQSNDIKGKKIFPLGFVYTAISKVNYFMYDTFTIYLVV